MSSETPANEPEKQPVGTLTDPVALGNRIESLDVLRGFALLGILVINIVLFSYPTSVMQNPTVAGGFTGIDFFSWQISYLFFSMKFMAIFSMLFGAGIILLTERAESRGVSVRPAFFRRQWWLLLFGALHAYFVWFGDILFPYAICGMIVYLFRRKSARFLVIFGLIVTLFGLAPMAGVGALLGWMQGQAESGQAALDAGEKPDPMEQRMIEVWDEVEQGFHPNEETLREETDIMRSGYWDIILHQLPTVLQMHLISYPFFIVWRIAGLMLVGMGLMKLGVFSAQRSVRFYRWSAVIGYAVGLPLVWYGSTLLVGHNFDPAYMYTIGGSVDYVAGLLMVLGHIGLVMLVCKRQLLTGVRKRLAAVGRMALSNYLIQSLIGTFIFYGWGLGYFGEFNRAALWWFVLGIWALQLVYSPLWLSRFRFGPFEWLWRSLTYKKRQPMRMAAETS
ncbi:DUF418 domain-containing protein [bacterium]|nr:DUF418 domain-containing protein [bacterium]